MLLGHDKTDFLFVSVSLSMLVGCSSSGSGSNQCSSLLGCSSSGGGNQSALCSDVTPCGGNVVGTWTITSSCLSSTYTTAEACGSVPALDTMTVAGSVTLGSDMTYSRTTSLAGTEATTVPASCLTTGGVTLTCAQIQQELATLGNTATCTGGSGGGCVRDAPITSSSTTETGTYSTSGDTITLTSSTGSASTSPYCVSGNGSTLTLTPTNVGPAGFTYHRERRPHKAVARAPTTRDERSTPSRVSRACRRRARG